eukprot:scaffold8637_cov127-Isochrysis_galbana.AAC.6
MQTTYGPATLRRSKRAALPPLGHASEKGRKAHMHRQQTTQAAPPRSECGRSHRPPVRGETNGTWIRPPSGVGATSNKQGSTKHKGRGKSEHTDRDLSLGHMRVRHHTSCVRTRPTAVNTSPTASPKACNLGAQCPRTAGP